MAEPWTFSFEPVDQFFTFSNGHVEFHVDTQFEFPLPPETVTVESVTLKNPHFSDDPGITLGITNVEVPSPLVEHLASHFPDLLI